MLNLFTGLEFYTGFMLLIALIFVLIYEIINGFHDAANAIATVIYTKTLRLQLAISMSGIFNFLGVVLGGLSVAYSIVHLLPIDLLINVSSTHSLIMMFSILLSAIIWNLITWYFCLPSSSSHTLIGAIIGIGLTNSLINKKSIILSLNIPKLIEVFLSLIISPFIGLILASIIVLLLQKYWNFLKKKQKNNSLSKKQKNLTKCKPPFWMKISLIFSSAGVSFFHGANDGQKGIGLIMLLLISIAPSMFVLDMRATNYEINKTLIAINDLQKYIKNDKTFIESLNFKKIIITKKNKIFFEETDNHYLNIKKDSFFFSSNNNFDKQEKNIYCDLSKMLSSIEYVSFLLTNLNNYNFLNSDQRLQLRYSLVYIADKTDKIAHLSGINSIDKQFLIKIKKDLLKTVEYAPIWIVVAVATSLAIGTIFGWKRIAFTISEKIGKKNINYVQGLSAQLTATISIGLASYTGMPVSTTHVLSSAVAGTMLVNGIGIRKKTVKNILLAWMLTLPVTIILSGFLYFLFLQLIKI